MFIRAHQCWFPKEVESPNEYEDASACSERAGRVVIADGVSSAIFSRDWARLLTRTAVIDPPDTYDSQKFLEWVKPLQDAWRDKVDFQTVSQDWRRGPKLKSTGAQSTLLILEVDCPDDEDGHNENDRRLRAHAIGDCCLFLIRNSEKVLSFPMCDADAFAEPPHIISSINKKAEYAEKFCHLEDYCQIGDLIVVCTDAIGLWAMEEYQRGNQIDWLRYWDHDSAWQSDIQELRDRSPKDTRGRMRVDDCTLVLLKVISEEVPRETLPIQPDRSDEPFELLHAVHPSDEKEAESDVDVVYNSQQHEMHEPQGIQTEVSHSSVTHAEDCGIQQNDKGPHGSGSSLTEHISQEQTTDEQSVCNQEDGSETIQQKGNDGDANLGQPASPPAKEQDKITDSFWKKWLG